MDFVVHSILWLWKSSCKNYVVILCFDSHIAFYNHFSKKGSGWVGGIENVYHDPCQDWMDLVNMKLTSPNYPKPYDPLEYCTWNITAPQGHFVTLNFETIDVSNFELRGKNA